VGPHVCAVCTCLLVTLGGILVGLGVQLNLFSLALLGRVCLGLGGEATFALQQTLCTWWFDARFQPFAMGVAISAGSMGEVLNFLVTQQLYGGLGFATTIWGAVVPCVASIGAGVALLVLARRRQRDAHTLRAYGSPGGGGGGEARGEDSDCEARPLLAIGKASPGSGSWFGSGGGSSGAASGGACARDSSGGSGSGGGSSDSAQQSWRDLVAGEPLLHYFVNLCLLSPCVCTHRSRRTQTRRPCIEIQQLILSCECSGQSLTFSRVHLLRRMELRARGGGMGAQVLLLPVHRAAVHAGALGQRRGRDHRPVGPARVLLRDPHGGGSGHWMGLRWFAGPAAALLAGGWVRLGCGGVLRTGPGAGGCAPLCGHFLCGNGDGRGDRDADAESIADGGSGPPRQRIWHLVRLAERRAGIVDRHGGLVGGGGKRKRGSDV